MLAFVLFLCFVVYTSSCSKDHNEQIQEEKVDASISFLTNDSTVDCEAGDVSISFTSSDSWTAISNVDWISIDVTNGEAGTATIKAHVSQNTTYDQRNGSITIKTENVSKNITITQKQLNALILSSNKIEVVSQGCVSTIDVKTNIAYQVSIDEACKEWISIISTKSLETYNIILKIAENSSIFKREGKIKIFSEDKSEEIIIYQQGSDPTIVLSQNLIEVDGFGEIVKVELKSNISYEMLMPDVSWISVNNTRSLSSYTHYFNISENRGEESREAEIVFINRSLGISETVIIKQKPIEKKLSGKWHLGWWILGTVNIHFDGKETISIDGDVLTWSGQQEADGNGVYELTYAEDYLSFIAKKSGKETRFFIRYYSKDILVIQEGNASGPLRYWFNSIEKAIASDMASLPEIEVEETKIPDPSHSEKINVEDILVYRSGITDSNITPMGRHFEGVHQTTAADIEWLLDPNNEPDYRYANDNFNAPIFNVWKELPVDLYPFGSPEPADVNQHAIGDCSFCAVMASMAYLYPDFLKEIITDNNNGTYTVKLYDPLGKTVSVCIKSTFLCDGNGNLAQVTGKNNVVTWSTVLEKAVMKYQTVYKVDNIYGIGTEFVAPILTGDGRSFSFSPNQLWNNELKLIANWAVEEGMIGVGGFNKPNLKCGSLYTVVAHAFTIMKTNHESEGYLFSMRNPWGIESVDGVLDVPNTRSVCSTIDFRLVYPGAAKPFLKLNRGAYVPPVWSKRSSDLGVSSKLLQLTNCKTIKPSYFYK